jgi:hypothetical protein
MSLCMERAAAPNCVGEGSEGFVGAATANENPIDIVGAGSSGGSSSSNTSPVNEGEEGGALTMFPPTRMNTLTALMPDDMKRQVAGFLEKPNFSIGSCSVNWFVTAR